MILLQYILLLAGLCYNSYNSFSLVPGLYTAHEKQAAREATETSTGNEIQGAQEVHQMFPWLGPIQRSVRRLNPLDPCDCDTRLSVLMEILWNKHYFIGALQKCI